ncbi:Pre-mRNA-splicing factor cwf23 [Rhodotorula toruloides]|nr:Pre-mRNA-splicing factor cwf23 [Rhodotorula toruloides]
MNPSPPRLSTLSSCYPPSLSHTMASEDVDYYALLGIESTATSGEIRKAYRQKSLKVHPDRNPDDPQAAALFHELSIAVDVLSDPSKRSTFDSLLAARNARKARFAALDNKRKAMAEELERSERESKRAREGERSKKMEVERLKEEGRRLREERARQAQGAEEGRRKVREEEERRRVEEQRANGRTNGAPAEVVELGPLDKTLKIKWLKSAHPSLVDDASVTAFLERTLAPANPDIDSVVLSSKTLANPSKGKHGSGVLAFKTLSAAVRVVKGKEADPEGRWKGFEVGWAAGGAFTATSSTICVSASIRRTLLLLCPRLDRRRLDPRSPTTERAREADGRDAAAGRGGRGSGAMNELLLHVRRCRVRGALMRGGVGESEALWLAHWALHDSRVHATSLTMATAASPAPPPPHPVLSSPILYLSGLPSSVADEEIVEALKDCLRLRLFLQRDEQNPTVPMSGKIEFETLDKAERAYATCNNQRLSSGHILLLSFSPPSSSSTDLEPQATPRIIKHLARPFTASHLFSLCRPFGPIHSATLLLAPSPAGGPPKFKGQALVTFYDEHHAEEMQRGLHFTEVGGQSVAVQVWDAKRAAGGRGRASLGTTPSPGLSPNEKVSRWAATQQETPSKYSRYAGLAATGPSTPSTMPMRRDVSGASSTMSRLSSEAGETVQGGGGGAGGAGQAGSDPRNLFIKNLDPCLSVPALTALFSPFGALTSTTIALDPLTNRSKGFGFVAFERAEDAERALRGVDGMQVGGRRVTVRVHEKREVRRERLEREFAREKKKEEEGVEEVREGMEGLSTGPTTPSSSPSRTTKPVSPLSPSDATSTPPQPQPAESNEESEHDRLAAAVREVLGPDVPAEKRGEVIKLLESLPKKDRKMCLFNSEFCRRKVEDALGILEAEDEGEEEKVEAPTAPPTQPMSLSTLAALPCSQILPLLPSLSPPLLPSPSDTAPTTTFMDSLSGKPVSEVKQRLGEKVFRVVKECARERGVKGAPRITIDLLDSEPDLRALALIALHYRPVVAEKVVLVAARLAEEGRGNISRLRCASLSSLFHTRTQNTHARKMATVNEKQPATDAPLAHETAIHRALDYPVIKDTLSTFDHYAHSHPYISSLYSRTLSLSRQILAHVQPVLPLELADQYANKTLDVVEKYVPQVKMETGELIGKARGPADAAFQTAQEYRQGLQSRISPVTDQLYQRITTSQAHLSSLQDRLQKTIKQLPHDTESLQSTLHSILNEVDGLVKSAQSIPANAQATAKPVFDGVVEAADHIRKEVTRTDIPMGARAQNVLTYTQDRLQPVVEQIKSFVLKKKDEVAETVEEKEGEGEKQEWASRDPILTAVGSHRHRPRSLPPRLLASERMSPAPRVRVSAGPSLSSLEPISINGPPLSISSTSWEGSISVRLKDYPGLKEGEGEGLEEGVTWSISFEGRWKGEVSAEEVVSLLSLLLLSLKGGKEGSADGFCEDRRVAQMFGNVWEKPIKSYGTAAALRFMRYVDPSLECDLYADKPWALSPLFATLQYMSVREHPPTEPLPPFKPDSFPEDLSPLLPSSDAPSLVGNPSARRSYFSKSPHRSQTLLTPSHILRADFSHGFINFDSLSVSLPGGLSFSLAKYWNGEPVVFSCQRKGTGEKWFVVSFVLEGDGEGGEGKGEGEKESEDPVSTPSLVLKRFVSPRTSSSTRLDDHDPRDQAMSTDGTGRCLVCYAAMKNRCSRCAGAGVDLFFCSPEHQKLAWQGHRLFCGPSAYQLVFPGLSDEELTAVFENLYKPQAMPNRGLFKPSDIFSLDGQMTPELLEGFIREELTKTAPKHQDSSPQYLLMRLRTIYPLESLSLSAQLLSRFSNIMDRFVARGMNLGCDVVAPMVALRTSPPRLHCHDSDRARSQAANSQGRSGLHFLGTDLELVPSASLEFEIVESHFYGLNALDKVLAKHFISSRTSSSTRLDKHDPRDRAMSTDGTGRCLVCYAETKNRCSRCGEAGIDLFFCSPEHQKLAWPGHRIFCGPNAFPLLFPYFTDAELEDLFTKLEQPSFGEDGRTTLLASLQKSWSWNLKLEEVKSLLRRCTLTAKDREPLDSSWAQFFLSAFRAVPDEGKIATAYLLWALATWVKTLLRADNVSFPQLTGDRTWPETEILHRALAIETIINHSNAGGSHAEEEAYYESNLITANLALQAYLKDAFPTERAAAFHRALAQRFLWDVMWKFGGGGVATG